MNNKILISIVGTIFLIGLLVFARSWVIGVNMRTSLEIQKIHKEVLARESRLFELIPKMTNGVFDFWSISERDACDALFVFIPNETCWACFEPKLKRIESLANKYSTEIIYITSMAHMRTLKITLPDKLFTKKVMSFSSLGFKNSDSLLSKDIVFVLYNNSSQLCIPYIENKLVDPVSFLEKNYFKFH